MPERRIDFSRDSTHEAGGAIKELLFEALRADSNVVPQAAEAVCPWRTVAPKP